MIGERTRPALIGLMLAASLSARAQVTARGNCPTTTNFEAARYTIRVARIEGPFMFLPWMRVRFADAEKDLVGLAGKPFKQSDVVAKAKELLDVSFLPDNGNQRVRFTVVISTVENCVDQKLDVVYTVFTSQINPLSGATLESKKEEQAAPEKAAGTDRADAGWRLAPAGGYDPAYRFFGGVSAEYRPAGAGRALLHSIGVEGAASGSMHRFAVNLAGSHDADGQVIRHAEWQLDYLDALDPQAKNELRKKRLAAQFSAITSPLGRMQWPFRFGGQVEAGKLNSDVLANRLPAATVPGSDYGAAKLYAGTTMRLDRHAFAASYGLEIGSNTSSRIDWVKQIADFGDDFNLPVGDHRSLEIESRLTAGRIQVRGVIPLAARFLVGNRDEPFVLGESWNVRGNPVIRSIPATRLDPAGDGAGGTRFFAYNMTAAVPVWRTPVVPPELSGDAQFDDELKTQLATATSFVAADFLASDPHFALTAGKIADAEKTLADLGTAVSAAAASHPGQFEDSFKECASSIRVAARRAKGASEKKGGEQFGDVAALLSADENLLAGVDSACIGNLNAQLHDTAIAAAAATLRDLHVAMEGEFKLIDQPRASERAEAEMAVVKRVMGSIVHELNIVSISPILGLDVARIGGSPAASGTRYGIGVGARVTLVNSADFTAGYFANPRRLRGEPAGAFFFAFRLRDLLQ